ncbi:MAG: flavodoxin family protein [Methanobacteriaceae archaeon]|jgi:multimeric flavodoxin WrbA|nr:flavodoxin family protein [Methanobacteriaceae archaeon]MDO9627672.1 flavodoxin family protein [Methanobacteriaceae archaeon]
MKMKVLAIMGSPRKRGNTYQATQELEKEMRKLGDVKFEYLFLQDAHLEMCRGCFNCLSRGEEFCSLKDDREDIEKRILEADGVIFASPVYCQMVSGLMKNFIDRFAYIFHRPVFFKQRALAICTTAGSGANETLKYLETLHIWGFGKMNKLGIIIPPWPMSEALKKKNQRNIEKSAHEFYKSLEKGGMARPTFNEYVHFRFMKFTSSMGEYFPADHEFYQDKDSYFYPLKISPFKRIGVTIMMKIVLFLMRDMGPAEN